MAKIKKHLIGVFLVSLCIATILACKTSKDTFDKNSNGWMPQDLNVKSNVLLIEEMRIKNAQRDLSKYMQENYPYKYEFVSAKALSDSAFKYRNNNRYHYVLQSSFGQHSTMKAGLNESTYNVIDFHFVDLKSGESYPNTGIATSYAVTVFRVIIKKIVSEANK